MKRWGRPEDDDPEMAEWGIPKLLDERRHPIGRVLGEASTPIHYLYDFGDDWHLRLDFVESRMAQGDEPPARVVKARLRGPTEDSGGVWGWQEVRRILSTPSDPEHEHIASWLEDVDAERSLIDDVVDLDALNEQLAKALRSHPPRA